MADIAPFRGFRYDTSDRSEKSGLHADAVLAPPYDVIDAKGRAALAAKDPRNCVQLILPEGEGDAKYDNAARILDGWIADGTLVRDEQPALYRYHQVFTSAELGGATAVRMGFVAAVRLHQFDEGVILRHELTLSGPKVDRLKLMGATGCHLSQIFALYSDPSLETDRAFARHEKATPDLDAVSDDGTRHLLWKVTDRETIGEVTRVLAARKLYIADGHHRYETMLALRDQMREAAGGELDSDSSGEFGTIFLANMDDPGLVVLPTHRLVHSLPTFDANELLKGLEAYFSIRSVDEADNATATRRLLADAAKRGPSIAMMFPESPRVHLLSLRADFHPVSVGLELPMVLRQLDVTILHAVVIEHLLGIDKAAQEAKTNLAYFKDTAAAIAQRGQGQVLFLMNPTPVEQVRQVSDAGEVMPQKSTFFFPKIASGIVFNRIDPTESVGR